VKILLDECVPLPLRKLLIGHECSSAQEMGWNSIKNSELLALAEAQLDGLDLRHQLHEWSRIA
jgi:hypothetical protein